jgi:alanine racemase
MYSLSQIAQFINAKLFGDKKAEISRLLIDSRAVSFPSESLFVALRSSRNDGHRYIADLYEARVRNFLVSELPDVKRFPEANFLLVDNTLSALQLLATKHRAEFTCPIIGIAGSNGKTIVKEWLYQLLQQDYRITRSPRSYNSQIGVPLSVWELNGQTELGIFEAGISLPGEMEKLQPIISPTIGIFTHLGEAHQENFSSQKEKCTEKLKLFINSEVLIYQKDNKLLDIAVAQSGTRAKLFTWGYSSKADVQVIEQKKENGETKIVCSCPQFSILNFQFSIHFTDDASIENALHCLCLLLYLGIKEELINTRMKALEPVAMRLEVKDGLNDCLVIDDAYNSDFTSLSIALDFLQNQASAKNLKRTLILSDILQSGEDNLYEKVAELLLQKSVNKLIAIGSAIKNKESKIKNILGEKCESIFFDTTDEFLSSQFSAFNSPFSHEAILLKGSRQYRFERISEKIESIVHQTVLEVDLNALAHNVHYFRSKLKPETKLMSMVKAYAYGSGDIEVARSLQHLGCDYLAVAVADEGATLRNEGIHIPIVVMNPEPSALNKIIEYQLEPEIYNFHILEAFRKEAERQGVSNYPVHIKIDSGMHRLGFEPAEVDPLITDLTAQQTLMVRSVFSHLAGADESQFDSFTEQQVTCFLGCYAKFEQAFSYKIMKHILNSAGIERFADYQFDMVRLGIGHYGVSAVENTRLEEVCTLKTTILQIRKVQAGETVGYGRKGKITHDSIIGVIPIGYADGYNRKLSNGVGRVLINGHYAPVIGNICMDLTMIDLTGIPANEGDSVILFGKGLSVTEIARILQTIPYEVLTNISRRVKRVYFKE